MKRILILGADQSIVDLLSGASELAGCAIEAAAGGADALHRLRRRAYDAVITSPQTPVEEDVALLEEMRELRPGVKAILLAPSATPDQVISAMRARAFA